MRQPRAISPMSVMRRKVNHAAGLPSLPTIPARPWLVAAFRTMAWTQIRADRAQLIIRFGETELRLPWRTL